MNAARYSLFLLVIATVTSCSAANSPVAPGSGLEPAPPFVMVPYPPPQPGIYVFTDTGESASEWRRSSQIIIVDGQNFVLHYYPQGHVHPGTYTYSNETGLLTFFLSSPVNQRMGTGHAQGDVLTVFYGDEVDGIETVVYTRRP